jgi:hypothetical protein
VELLRVLLPEHTEHHADSPTTGGPQPAASNPTTSRDAHLVCQFGHGDRDRIRFAACDGLCDSGACCRADADACRRVNDVDTARELARVLGGISDVEVIGSSKLVDDEVMPGGPLVEACAGVGDLVPPRIADAMAAGHCTPSQATRDVERCDADASARGTGKG